MPPVDAVVVSLSKFWTVSESPGALVTAAALGKQTNIKDITALTQQILKPTVNSSWGGLWGAFHILFVLGWVIFCFYL